MARRYDLGRLKQAVDPDNRVVARTLENDWEQKLREIERLELAYEEARRVEKVELSSRDRAQLLALASDLPRVWEASTTTNVQRKNLLRLLIKHVALTPVEVPRRLTRVQVQWSTGVVTDTLVDRPRHPVTNGSPVEAVDRIRELVAADHTDEEIAQELNASGLSRASGGAWTTESVRGVRKRRGLHRTWLGADDGRVPLQRENGLLSTRGLAEHYGVTPRRIRTWAEQGQIRPTEGGRGTRRPMWFTLDEELDHKMTALVARIHRNREP